MIAEALRSRKNKLEASIRNQLFGHRIFFPARTAYQCVFNRSKLEHRRRMRALYGQFIRPRDLVFDVGANIGVYSEIFAELGARVIAVEPNPSCGRLLERLSRNRDVRVELLAVGPAPGVTPFYLNSHDDLSSVDPVWCEAVNESPLRGISYWMDPIDVEVTTLDLLAGRYGTPNFVKIDVEGYDDRVLRGMSFRPEGLSFEFNTLVPDVAMRCLQSPILASGYEFNYIHGAAMRCASPTWLNRDDLWKRMDVLVEGDLSGDVIARSITRSWG